MADIEHNLSQCELERVTSLHANLVREIDGERPHGDRSCFTFCTCSSIRSSIISPLRQGRSKLDITHHRKNWKALVEAHQSRWKHECFWVSLTIVYHAANIEIQAPDAFARIHLVLEAAVKTLLFVRPYPNQFVP